MIYNAPTKGEDGLYFVKVLNDDKRKSLVQLNKVKITDVSGEIIMHLGSDANIDKIDGVDTQNLEAALENCESWFGKKVSDGVIRGAYTSTINAGSMTCDRIEATKVFNTQQEVIDFEAVQPEKNCDVILEFAGIWFAKKAFGPTWNVVQVKVHDDPIVDTYPDGYAFVEDEE
jgi:hypothetical protein|tara:strand:+ start:1803 stop:2321 length:519 start_codon:yes stop_codon:yes gene_type:complete